MGPVPADFVPKWRALAAHLGVVNVWAVLVATVTLAIIVVWPRVSRRIPSPFVALIVATAAVQLLHLPVETIGSRFGVINASLPAPALPAISLHQLPSLAGAAFTIALLGAIESLLSAVVADGWELLAVAAIKYPSTYTPRIVLGVFHFLNVEMHHDPLRSRACVPVAPSLHRRLVLLQPP